MREKRHNFKIIILLLLVFSCMTIGYAAFSTQLNVSGASQIASKWDIKITTVSAGVITGNAENSKVPTFTDLTANFEANLYEKGDAIEYEITVENKGTFDAVLENINTPNSNNPAIKITTSGITIGDKLYKNTSIKFKVKIEYDTNFSGTLVSNNGEASININYTQASGNINGGTGCFTTTDNSDGTLSITDYDVACGTDVIVPDYIDGKAVTKIADGTYDSTTGFHGAFAYKGLTSIKFPDTLTYIGNYTLMGNKIKILELPASIKKVGAYAFSYNQMERLTLSEGLVHVAVWAFGWNNLSELNLPNSLNIIEIGAFISNKLSKLDIPKSVTYLGGGAFNQNLLTGSDKVIYDRKSDGSIDYGTLASYGAKSYDGQVVASSVSNIKPYAFYDVNVGKINIPSNVKNIGENAFHNCSISEITFESGIETIGTHAFYGNKFTSINLPSSIKTIWAGAFLNNDLLTSITINRKEGSVAGTPWGVDKATIKWTGTN